MPPTWGGWGLGVAGPGALRRPRPERDLRSSARLEKEPAVLTIVKLRDAEYVLGKIARGLDEYYTSAREAPGVWAGRWSSELGLSGVVEGDHLRALVRGVDPASGTDLLAGNPPRKVNAFDVTLSAPKSVSLLQALSTPEVAAAVSTAHTEALSVALDVLERHAALTRRQTDGVRRVVPTGGLSIATFAHRTSRAGDPQLHSHCVVANMVRRDDLRYVALDASYLYDWGKAVGSIYQEELRRRLTESLDVAWGEDRNGCREMLGFSDEQLRAFSKRTSEIESWIEAHGSTAPETPAEKRAAADAAALATRAQKDPSLTPEVLTARWRTEAQSLGVPTGEALVERVCHRAATNAPPSGEVVFAELLDPERGLCARRSRFGEAQVTAAIAATGAGTLSVSRIEELTAEFLGSRHVVRLAPPLEVAGRRPAQWSLVAHRRREDSVLNALGVLASRQDRGIEPELVERVLGGLSLGADQCQAVRELCGRGPALRALISPAGHGKTTALAAAAEVARAAGRLVVGISTTHQAVGELRRVGIPSVTIAAMLAGPRGRNIPAGAVLILDEMSQCSTKDAEAVLQIARDIPGCELWCAGDATQAQAVAAGGLGAEIERMARSTEIPMATLSVNRRQLDEAEKEALSAYRDRDVSKSQELRTQGGLEHELENAVKTKLAMAKAVLEDIGRLGADGVVALCATHGEAEEIADAIRARLKEKRLLRGPSLRGPGWTRDRSYVEGDRVLLHATAKGPWAELHNGDVVTVVGVDRHALYVSTRNVKVIPLSVSFATGYRSDGRPNLSHAWARTVEGSQGGTWEQVHLLASPSLDHQSGYVGQSRGRRPTHTWNVGRTVDADHGGRVVGPATASEAVREALERDGAQLFAARDDPYRTDRVLRSERQEHLAVLANRPEFDAEELERANAMLDKARSDFDRASAMAEEAESEMKFSRLELLTHSGRERAAWARLLYDQHDSWRAEAHKKVERSRSHVAELEAARDAHRAFDAVEGWREKRGKQIDPELAEHWSRAVLAAVREGDPLAFGEKRLLAARYTVERDLDRQAGSSSSHEISERETQQDGEVAPTGWSSADLRALEAAIRSVNTYDPVQEILASSRRSRNSGRERSGYHDYHRQPHRAPRRDQGRGFGR